MRARVKPRYKNSVYEHLPINTWSARAAKNSYSIITKAASVFQIPQRNQIERRDQIRKFCQRTRNCYGPTFLTKKVERLVQVVGLLVATEIKQTVRRSIHGESIDDATVADSNGQAQPK